MIAVIITDREKHKQEMYILFEGKMVPQGSCLTGKCEQELAGKGYHELGNIQVHPGYDIKIYAAPGRVVFDTGSEKYLEEFPSHDNRLYGRFLVQPFHGDTFHAEIVAQTSDEQSLPFPYCVKRYYRSIREAEAVAIFLNLYIKGKTIRETQSALAQLFRM